MACCCSGKVAVAAEAPSPAAAAAAAAAGNDGAGIEVSAVGVLPPGLEAATVMVVVRVRPPNARETAARAVSVVEVTSKTSLALLEDTTGASHAPAADRQFTFDAVLGPAATQRDAYSYTGAPILSKFVAGFNACIFAYGQTGSGKTFTMEGAPGADTRGVMPRLAADLFTALAAKTGCTWALEATYVEIYQEAVRDLLTPLAAPPSASPTTTATPSAGGGAATRSALSPSAASAAAAAAAAAAATATPSAGGGAAARSALSPSAASAAAAAAAAAAATTLGGEPAIRQAPGGDIFLEGVVRRPVHSEGDIVALLAEGTARRARGETSMNAVSSRSHAVLTLYLRLHAAGDDDGLAATTSKLNLIDLAGSERADAAGTTGARLKEGARINQSLSALGNVINALTLPKRSHVPYRDSKLTRLLQDSLGANAYCLMVLCVSPASINYDETLSSLRFAERVKKVRNTPRVNVDPAAARIAALLADNAALRDRLARLEDFCAARGLRADLAAAGLALPADGAAAAAGRASSPPPPPPPPPRGAWGGCVIQ